MALWIICSALVVSGNGLLLIYFHWQWDSEERITLNFYPRLYTYKCRLPMFPFVLPPMYLSDMKHTSLRCGLHHLSYVGYNCCIEGALVSSAATSNHWLTGRYSANSFVRQTCSIFISSAQIFWQIINSAWFHCIYMYFLIVTKDKFVIYIYIYITNLPLVTIKQYIYMLRHGNLFRIVDPLSVKSWIFSEWSSNILALVISSLSAWTNCWASSWIYGVWRLYDVGEALPMVD